MFIPRLQEPKIPLQLLQLNWKFNLIIRIGVQPLCLRDLAVQKPRKITYGDNNLSVAPNGPNRKYPNHVLFQSHWTLNFLNRISAFNWPSWITVTCTLLRLAKQSVPISLIAFIWSQSCKIPSNGLRGRLGPVPLLRHRRTSSASIFSDCACYQIGPLE